MRRTLPALIRLLIIVGFSCSCSVVDRLDTPSSPSSEISIPAPPPAAQIKLSPLETADAIADPEKAGIGVWSLVANLGIGVYTGDGEQIFAGSELSEQDFWLYDFELPLLAHLAQGDPRPFSLTTSRLIAVGFKGATTDLIRVYRDAYALNNDKFLVQLFGAMDVKFREGLELTPLQEWLLMLDTFVPANGSTAAKGGFLFSVIPKRAAFPAFAQGVPCGFISGGQVQANWGIIQSGTDLGAYLAAEAAYYAIHGLLFAQSIDARMEASPNSAHEGHGGPGDVIDLTATVTMSYVPQSIPVGGTLCGILVNLDPPVVGPQQGVDIEWDIPAALLEHGAVDMPGGGASLTDYQGQSRVRFQARQEAANGKGEEEFEDGVVRAIYDLRNYLANNGYRDPRMLSLIPERMPIYPPAVVQISWHELCAQLELEIDYWQVVSVRDVLDERTLKGTIPFEIDFTQEPAILSGGAVLSLGGQGSAPECTWTNSGTVEATLSGTMDKVDDGRDRLIVELDNEFNSETTFHCEGGTNIAQIPQMIPSETELMYEDGYSIEWDIGVPGLPVEGHAIWTLNFVCP
ncbi:MAG: hypothetical protein WBB65_06340 [Anaerolineales bacterium]